MPEYIVKTLDDRNLVIEADSFNFDTLTYTFYKTPEASSGFETGHSNLARSSPSLGTLVASVPAHNVFAIVEEEAFQADFYRDDLDDDPDEDETDDTCLHCRFVEFTESQEFFDAVVSIVDVLNEPTHVYQASYEGGCPSWGFAYEDKFVPFENKEQAEDGLKRHLAGERNWGAHLLSEVTEVTQ